MAYFYSAPLAYYLSALYTTLSAFATAAEKHREEARLLALFAAMKGTHARAVDALAFAQSDTRLLCQQLAQEVEMQTQMLLEVLAPFFELASVQRLVGIWQEPIATMLLDSTRPTALNEPSLTGGVI